MNDKLLKLLELESKEIKLSFEKASIEGEGTPQEVAERRETALIRTFIGKYFPFPYRITKGNIIDSSNNRSNSIDCIVLSPSHPYTIDAKNEKASIIFADGVDFAIEIKPDLGNKKEIERSLQQIRSVKKLRRKRNGILFKKKYSVAQIETSYQIPTFIFAEKTYKDLRLLLQYIVDFYIKEKVPPEEQFDFIVINNRTIIFNSNEKSYAYISPNKGLLFSVTNENTLAAFLFWLNSILKSEPNMSPNVLTFYLDSKLFIKSMKTFDDLNYKLHSHIF